MRFFDFFHSNARSLNFSGQIGLPVLSGILLIVCQPPVSLFPFAFIALIPLLYAMAKYPYRHPFLPGFITGIVAYLGLIYWVIVAMNTYEGTRYLHQHAYTVVVCSISFPVPGFALRQQFLYLKKDVSSCLSMCPLCGHFWSTSEALPSQAFKVELPWPLPAQLPHLYSNCVYYLQLSYLFSLPPKNCIVFFVALKNQFQSLLTVILVL